jgi:hypothetical protein
VHLPVPTVARDTGRDLDEALDKPFDGELDLFALQVELTKQMQEVMS